MELSMKLKIQEAVRANDLTAIKRALGERGVKTELDDSCLTIRGYGTITRTPHGWVVTTGPLSEIEGGPIDVGTLVSDLTQIVDVWQGLGRVADEMADTFK